MCLQLTRRSKGFTLGSRSILCAPHRQVGSAQRVPGTTVGHGAVAVTQTGTQSRREHPGKAKNRAQNSPHPVSLPLSLAVTTITIFGNGQSRAAVPNAHRGPHVTRSARCTAFPAAPRAGRHCYLPLTDKDAEGERRE